MKIIGLSGAAGSGKDTAHQLLSDNFELQGLKCTKLSFAGKLKDICTLMFGWDRQRLEDDFDYKEGGLGNTNPDDVDPACVALGKTRRVVMQEMGTEAMRNGLHSDVWIIALKMAITNGEYDEYDVGFVTDMRFINELQFVEDMGGQTIQIQRRGPTTTLTTETNHASELEWRKWDRWTAIVDNYVSDDATMKYATMRDFKSNLLEVTWPFVKEEVAA